MDIFDLANIYIPNTLKTKFKEIKSLIDRKEYDEFIEVVNAVIGHYKKNKHDNENIYLQTIMKMIITYVCSKHDKLALRMLLCDHYFIIIHANDCLLNKFFSTQFLIVFMEYKCGTHLSANILASKYYRNLYYVQKDSYVNYADRDLLTEYCIKNVDNWSLNMNVVVTNLMAHAVHNAHIFVLKQLLQYFPLYDMGCELVQNFMYKTHSYMTVDMFKVILDNYKEHQHKYLCCIDHSHYFTSFRNSFIYELELYNMSYETMVESRLVDYYEYRQKRYAETLLIGLLIDRRYQNTKPKEFWEMFDHNVLYVVKDYIGYHQ